MITERNPVYKLIGGSAPQIRLLGCFCRVALRPAQKELVKHFLMTNVNSYHFCLYCLWKEGEFPTQSCWNIVKWEVSKTIQKPLAGIILGLPLIKSVKYYLCVDLSSFYINLYVISYLYTNNVMFLTLITVHWCTWDLKVSSLRFI